MTSETNGQRRTQAERRAESEHKLLRAALRLIATQGFVSTTLAQVGKEAGYSRGLVTQRFGSKIGLAHAIIGLIRQRFDEDVVPRMADVPDRFAMHVWVDRYIEALEADSATHRAVIALQAEGMTSLTELRADLADLNELWLEYLVGRLEAAQDQGEVAPGVDLRGTATAILGLLRGTASQFLIDPERVHLRGAGEAAKVMLSAALFENVASYGTQDA